ncbi:hypothetical protein H4R19_001382 [Coemansia spiralis]|nr:hypothetical protein H4R19_001382 [Coemansia spiralis]
MEPPAEFSRVLRCRPAADARYSDKILLPQSFLEALLDCRRGSARAFGEPALAADSADQLPSPLIFRLAQRRAAPPTAAVYCGVREFSCSEGEVTVPEWLMRCAGLQDGDSVAVEFVRIEKGTSAVLQAHDFAAQTVGDVRALLEAHMRTRLTALFVGETFHVPVGGMDRPLAFTVAALEPTAAVDVVDTDLSVDIIHAEPHTAAVPADSGAHGGAIEELLPGVPCELSVAADRPRVFQLHIPAHVQTTDVVLSCRPGSDASLCASRLVRSVGVLDNTWFDYSPPSQQPKRLRIGRDQLPSGASTVYVSAVGFQSPCSATIEARFDAPPASGLGTLSAQDPITSEDGESVCANCGASVPAARLEMHRAVCERHNVKCPSCTRVFKRGSSDLERHWHCEHCGVAGDCDDCAKHNHFYHTPCACACNPEHSYASLADMAEHRRTRCPERLIECQYCHTIVAQGPVATAAEAILLGQHEHEWDCGGRSIQCAKCKTYVSIRKVQLHMRVHAMKEETARANRVPCANRECSRERSDNPLGLCAICFGPLYTGQYDPGHHKLLKRLARNLHTQMTVGCASPKCHNQHCATGRRKAPSGPDLPPLSQTEAAAKLVPLLRAYAPLATTGSGSVDYAGIDLHLCL